MSNSDAQTVSAAQFDQQVAALKELAARTADACLAAQFIAASDSRVRDLFLKKINDGYVFKGIYCIDRIGLPENKYVVFDFDCKPGVFCLIAPAFLVVVNIVDRYIVAIVDPYIPTAARVAARPRGCSTGGSSLSLAGGYDPIQQKITIRVKGRAKLKCFGQTIFDESGSITVTVGISELPVCGVGNADLGADFLGVARVKAKACLGPDYVKVSEACIYATFAGDEYELACADDIIIPLPDATSVKKGCSCGK